jgi:tRNA dimethylallyltransferase
MAELTKSLIVVVGPTAVGKTSLSLSLAKQFNCPIMSADSRQFYKEMSIGTAKPTVSELKEVPHHFINSRSVNEFYTAGMYENDGMQELSEIYLQNDTCLLVGGSGLYINALCYGIDDIPSDEKVRNQLRERLETEGLEALQNQLQQIDPEYFNLGDMKNPRRVMRALEVFLISGKNYSSFRKSAKKIRPFNIIWVGLEIELEKLYVQINQRVDNMIASGLVDEVKFLEDRQELKSLKTVGYQEIFEHLAGKISLEEAVELIKRNSRRYAKRQLTWFKKNTDVKWFNPNDFERVMTHIESNKSN